MIDSAFQRLPVCTALPQLWASRRPAASRVLSAAAPRRLAHSWGNAEPTLHPIYLSSKPLKGCFCRSAGTDSADFSFSQAPPATASSSFHST